MKKIITLLVLVLLLGSCTKWLEEEQVATLSYGYYTTEQGCEALVNSVYEGLRVLSGDEWSYGMFNYGTDEYMKGYEWTQPYAQPEYNDYGADLDSEDKIGYPDVNEFWNLVYNAIDRCNVAVDKVAKLEGALGFMSTPEGKNSRIAEVKMIRAYHYFMLAQQFGALPFTLQPSSGAEEEWPRVDVSIVYDSIVADLEWAYIHAPETQAQYGRVTKDAVRHYLAKVLLTRSYSEENMLAGDEAANYDLGGNKDADLQRAATLIDEIDLGGRHSLLPDYASLWIEDEEANDEIIFSAQFNDTEGLNGSNGSYYKNAIHLYFFNQYDKGIPGMTRNLEYGRPFRRLFLTDYALDIHDRYNDSRLRKSLLEVFYCNDPNASNIPEWTEEELLFAFENTGIETIITETDTTERRWAIRYGDTIRVGEKKFTAAQDIADSDRKVLGDTAIVFLINDENTTLTDRDMIASGHTYFARYYWKTDENRNPVELVSHDRNDDLLEFGDSYVVGSSTITTSTWDRNKSPSLLKYWNPGKLGNYDSSVGTKDVYLARLAETYLLGAEIYGRMGDYSKAVYYINKVRYRAGYSGNDKTSLWLKYDGGSVDDLSASTKEAMEIEVGFWNTDEHELSTYPEGLATEEERFIAFILNERARELLGELHRWEDLKRTGTLLQRAYAFNNDVANYGDLQEFHRVRPIPITHLDAIKVDGRPLTADEKKAYQNDGYQ